MRIRTQSMILMGAVLPVSVALPQQDENLAITRSAIQFVRHELGSARLILDAGTLHADPAVADTLALELNAERNTLATVRECTTHPVTQRRSCRIRGGATVLAFKPAVIRGDTAEITLVWWQEGPAGYVGSQERGLRLLRTKGSWGVQYVFHKGSS